MSFVAMFVSEKEIRSLMALGMLSIAETRGEDATTLTLSLSSFFSPPRSKLNLEHSPEEISVFSLNNQQ